MSTSASELMLTASGDPDAELFILGSDLKTLAYGVGKVSRKSSPGLYKLRAIRGSTVREKLVELSTTPLDENMRIYEFSAVAPIGPVFGADSSAIETFAQKVIATGDRQPALSAGSAESTSRLLVFGHMPGGDDRAGPLANLRLFPWRQVAARHSLEDKVQSKRIGKEMWQGWSRQLAPGCHVLELHDGVQWTRQAVLVVPGWETRIFIRRAAPSKGTSLAAPPARPEISIQMAFPATPVVYYDHYETIEVARRALETNRPVIVDDDVVHNLLRSKWDNPVMGITGLHLFLEALERRDAPEKSRKRVDLSGKRIKDGAEIVRTVIDNLHRLLRGNVPEDVPVAALTGPIPADLAGLEARAARFLDPPSGPLPVIDHPPMFWASWMALRDMPADKARFQVQHAFWTSTAHSIAAGPYFCWQPKRVSLEGYVSDALEASATIGREVLGRTPPYFETFGSDAVRARGQASSRRGMLDLGDSREDIGRALGIPDSVIKTLS